MTRRPALAANNCQQVFRTGRSPFIALFGFGQDAKQRNFPIRELIPSTYLFFD
jgi:hypothetical protein